MPTFWAAGAQGDGLARAQVETETYVIVVLRIGVFACEGVGALVSFLALALAFCSFVSLPHYPPLAPPFPLSPPPFSCPLRRFPAPPLFLLGEAKEAGG